MMRHGRYLSLLAFGALAIGTGFTGWGLLNLTWPEAIPFADTALELDSALRRYLTYIGVCFLLVGALAMNGRRNAMAIGALVGAALSLLAGWLWPVLVSVWFFVASAILGRMVFSALRIGSASGNWIINCVVGAGFYGTLVGLLAFFPVNYPGLYAIGLALPLIIDRASLPAMWRSVLQAFSSRPATGWGTALLEILIAVVGLIHFVVALMPEVAHDALAMHLFIPVHLAQRQMWNFDVTTYVWAVMPMLGDWIFSIGYMLAGETASRMINTGFIFILSALLYAIVRWARGTVPSALWAVLLFLATPLTFTESSSLFIDSIWACFVIAGILHVLKACVSGSNAASHLVVAALLLAFASASKAVTLTILPLLFATLVPRYRVWLMRSNYRALAIGLAAFVLLAGIPYVTAYAITGNPVFPLYNGLFRSPYFPPVNFDAPLFATGTSWDALYRITFNSLNYLEAKNGAAGFQWLPLLLPAAIVLVGTWQRRAVALLAIGVVAVLVTFHSTAYLRYVFPSFVLLTGVIGLGLSAFVKLNPVLRKSAYLLSGLAVGLNLLFINAGAFYPDFALQSIFSGQPRENYLSKRIPIRNAVELVNRLNSGKTPVAVFALPLTAGLSADGIYPNWYNLSFYHEMEKADTDKMIVDILLNKGIDFVILDPTWNTPEKRRMIERVTEKLADFGGLSVRILSQDYRFKSELLKSPDFSHLSDWTMPGGEVRKIPEGVTVSVNAPLSQITGVKAGHRYLASVTARCDGQPTQGRIQLNWLDTESKFISTDIRVFDCGNDFETHSLEIVAPPKSAFAAVYVSGHAPTSLTYSAASFRK